MDIREFVAQGMERTRRRTLDVIEPAPQEHLIWRPGPQANPIGFLLFHTFRAEDRYFHHWLAQTGEVWEREGWNRRWPLPTNPANPAPNWSTGNSWTAEDVAAWKPPAKEELLEYGEKVRKSALQVLSRLDLSRLHEPAQAAYPERTRAFYLLQAIRHEAEHFGQIDYLLGLIKAGSRNS